MCRKSLKQLDEMTDGLRRRLLSGREADEQAAGDSEATVPLSTSSALMTAGSTLRDGTWELQSVSHSREHAAPDVMASTGGSASAGDAVTELMRRTLERTGSRSSYVEDMSHVVPRKHNHTFGGDDDDRNSLRDGTADQTGEILFHDGTAEQLNSETRASCDVVRYNDSLKTAQKLLKQLNEMTAGGSGRNTHSPAAVDFDEDEMQEDDTLANIWALRQSTGRDEGDVESLDSTIPPNELERSYVSPRTLNDVESNHEDSSSAASCTADDLGGRGDVEDVAELVVGRQQQASVSRSGESGDTWFIDTHDVRDADNMVSLEIRHRLSESGDNILSGADEAAEVLQNPPTDAHSPGQPLSHSSPSSLAQFSPAGRPALSAACKSRSLRKTAVQRREMYCEQHVGNSSNSNSESEDFVATSRLRHRRPQNSQCAPCHEPAASSGDDESPVNDASSAVVDDQVEDVVGHNQEIPVTAEQNIEDNEDEPQGAGSNIIPVQPVNQDSLGVNDDVIVSNEQVLNGRDGDHGVSDEDLYPSCHHL